MIIVRTPLQNPFNPFSHCPTFQSLFSDNNSSLISYPSQKKKILFLLTFFLTQFLEIVTVTQLPNYGFQQNLHAKSEGVIMDGRRRDCNRRSQNRKPTCWFWQPTASAWEREFGNVVGSMDWETLLMMKRSKHLYNNVMAWNDSACEEAYSNAKKRHWAKRNSLPCDVALPDPDLYIDKINWDPDNDPEMLLSDCESLPTSPKAEEDHSHNHDPVVTCGHSAAPDQLLAMLGWGDEQENLLAQVTRSSPNYFDPWDPSVWQGCPNDGWPGYSNDAWQYSNESRHGDMPWEGDWSNWSWKHANNNSNNHVGFDPWDDGDEGLWDDNPITGSGGFVSSYKTWSMETNGRKHIPMNGEERDKATYKRSSTREWNSNSVSVGQTWDWE